MKDFYCTTQVVRCDVYPNQILMESEHPIDCTNGKTTSINGQDYVIVGHMNYHTFSMFQYQRTIYVVLSKWYEKVENPKDGDNAIIGYYYYRSANLITDPPDYHPHKEEVRRNPHVDSDWLFKSYGW